MGQKSQNSDFPDGFFILLPLLCGNVIIDCFGDPGALMSNSPCDNLKWDSLFCQKCNMGMPEDVRVEVLL